MQCLRLQAFQRDHGLWKDHWSQNYLAFGWMDLEALIKLCFCKVDRNRFYWTIKSRSNDGSALVGIPRCIDVVIKEASFSLSIEHLSKRFRTLKCLTCLVSTKNKFYSALDASIPTKAKWKVPGEQQWMERLSPCSFVQINFSWLFVPDINDMFSQTFRIGLFEGLQRSSLRSKHLACGGGIPGSMFSRRHIFQFRIICRLKRLNKLTN